MSTRDRPLRPGLILVLVGLVAFAPRTVSGQTQWDPEAYEALSQSGQETYRSAMEHPADSGDRHDGLLEASAQMKEALAMISGAIEGEAIDQDDVDNALGDFFTLMENLSVVWLRLNACVPAQGLVDTALTHPELPDGGEVIFERLAPQIADCRERAEAWEWPRYAGLVARANLRAGQARERDPPDRELLEQAADASQDALRQYRSALFGGKLADIPVDDPVIELFARYDETVGLLIDVGRCDAARERLTAANLDASVLLQVTEVTSSHSGRIESCVQWVEQEVAVVPQGGAPAGPTTRDVISYSLLSASGVLLVSVLAVDLSSRGDRDELNDLQAACAVGPCDLDRAHSLADTIDQRKVVVGVLLGAALATGVTGLVLLFTGDDEPAGGAGDVTWAPIIAADAWGVGVGVRY